ncbi:MAG: hypothetical protein NWF07_09260 [Candidatus Bathyarchaeota archaeon]|nr:hypothetical protein [Candidatus Bathyarchaeota archaeon]
MLTKRTLLVTLLIATLALPTVYGQETTPTSLDITVYSDGTAKTVYDLEADPTEVRVSVELFGPPYSNLVIRDEDGNPLGYAVDGANVTIDSIGALELNIQYITSSLTAKYGSLWELNVSAPTETRIILPSGASIVDFLMLPINIGVVDGKTYLDFEAGELSLYYLLGLPSIAVDADEAINTADEYITDMAGDGYQLESAESMLSQAETLYTQGSYLEAKNQAEAALRSAQDTVDDADNAENAILRAETAINEAVAEERTVNLAAAETAYASSVDLFDEGNYVEAENVANQAYQLALQAETEPSGGNTMLYAGLLVLLLAAGGGGYMYMQKNKMGDDGIVPHTKQQAEIDLDKILNEHDLKLEDREVLRFIADSQGEVFASEIRDRFEMPRSTTWRLIQRLKDLEIIEEVKIGNQSLLRIDARYHREVE